MIPQFVDKPDGPDLEHLRQWLGANGFKQSSMFWCSTQQMPVPGWQRELPVGRCSLLIVFLHSAPSWAPGPVRENRERGSGCLCVPCALVLQLAVGSRVRPPAPGHGWEKDRPCPNHTDRSVSG